MGGTFLRSSSIELYGGSMRKEQGEKGHEKRRTMSDLESFWIGSREWGETVTGETSMGKRETETSARSSIGERHRLLDRCSRGERSPGRVRRLTSVRYPTMRRHSIFTFWSAGRLCSRT